MTEGFDVYAELVKSLVDAERTRKTSLEQKASAVITTSGTLVTLLFGLVAVITSKASYALPTAAHGWLGAAVWAFVLAACIALMISVPRPYGQIELTNAKLLALWSDPVKKAQAQVTGVRLRALETARSRNTTKAWMLAAAIFAELIAVGLLATAVVVVLHQAKPIP